MRRNAKAIREAKFRGVWGGGWVGGGEWGEGGGRVAIYEQSNI